MLHCPYAVASIERNHIGANHELGFTNKEAPHTTPI